MFRQGMLVMAMVLVAGCASVPRAVPPPVVSDPAPVVTTKIEPVLSAEVPGAASPAETPQTKPSRIFGKTDFRGLLKRAYVRLTIEDRERKGPAFFFIIGSPENQSVVPWKEGKVIEPGYFYLDIPPGEYRITRIAIPVGTTMAEEDVAVALDVPEESAVYVGTLIVDGTGERVKFGGVPVVKPGFEYHLEVLDEMPEAIREPGTPEAIGTLKLAKQLFQVESQE
ncbi:MAG: hypothetical protein GX606_03280 [Elusimicrobia bacterium]|nr:hypothetical protein [Elusimicrobiota bacterium]